MTEENNERNGFISRIGTFFLLLGMLVLVIFVASDVGKDTYFGFFFIATTLFVTGFIFKRMGAEPPSPSKRFEGLRKIQQQRREAKSKKQAEKKKR